MNSNGNLVGTINAGSLSLRFALFEMGKEITRKFVGKFERIGSAGAGPTTEDFSNNEKTTKAITMADHVAAIPILVEWLEKAIPIGSVAGIGHRVVHGGPRYFEPQQVDGVMLKELRRVSPADPTHLPVEISVIKNLAERYPKTPQIACFDTGFHRSMPRLARLLPIPRRYFEQGVQRYGFHGLSYSYQVGELERIEGAPIKGRIILAHLGGGASLAAVRDGKCIDTTMAFTPAAGLMMSTRSGDIDPGLPAYFARTERMNAEQFDRMINAESGLLAFRKQARTCGISWRKRILMPGPRRHWRFLLSGKEVDPCTQRRARWPGYARVFRRNWAELRRDPRAHLRRPGISWSRAEPGFEHGARAGHLGEGKQSDCACHSHGRGALHRSECLGAHWQRIEIRVGRAKQTCLCLEAR